LAAFVLLLGAASEIAAQALLREQALAQVVARDPVRLGRCELCEFALLITPTRGAQTLVTVLRVECEESLRARTARLARFDARPPLVLARGRAQVPERHAERGAAAQLDVLLARDDEPLQMHLVDAHDLGAEQEGTPPTRAVDAV